jgi:hypothetical protein
MMERLLFARTNVNGRRHQMPKAKKKQEVDVYETLGPNECLIISKTEKDMLVACNKKGEVKVKRIKIPNPED